MPLCRIKVDHLNAHNLRHSVLEEMTSQAIALIKHANANPDIDKMKAWFGNRAVVQDNEVHNTIILATNFLARWCDEGKIVYVSKNWKGIIGACDQEKEDREIFLCNAFPIKRWSWGERVGTILHELSHKVLATKDLSFKNESAYGILCKRMADDQKEYEKALTNAENWGYYFCSYRVAAGLTNKDRGDPAWKWLDPRDWIGGRDAFSGDVVGQQVDDGMIDGSQLPVLGVMRPQLEEDKQAVQKPVKLKSKKNNKHACKCGDTFEAPFLLNIHKKDCKACQE